MTFDVETVSVKTAQDWLANKNKINRDLATMSVDDLANTMAQDHYRFTFEPIVFCDEYKAPDTGEEFGETLMEGQHRLAALVKSGKPQKFLVIRHADPAMFQVIGTGRPRSIADQLKINRRSLKYPGPAAAVCSGFLRYGLGLRGRVQLWMVDALLSEISPEIEAVMRYKRKLKGMLRGESVSALLLAQIAEPNKTDFLIAQLVAKTGIRPGSPVHALQNYLYSYILEKDKRDLRSVYFMKTCSILAAGLAERGFPGNPSKMKPDPAGLGELRTLAKSRLTPLVKAVLGKLPENFYTPVLPGSQRAAIAS